MSDRNKMEGLRHSGLVTALILLVIFAVLGGVWVAHLHGRIHQLTSGHPAAEAPPPPRPGGMELIQLHRISISNSLTPDFLSAVLAPGLGLRVQQASITLPDRGEEPLLLSTPVANQVQAGDHALGARFSVQVQMPEGGHWSPAVETVVGHAADDVNQGSMPDGGSATGTFSGGKAGVESQIAVVLSGRALDLTLHAKNKSDARRAVVLTWEPNFQASDHGLEGMSIKPPMAEHVSDGTPIETAVYPLGAANIDRIYSNLKRSYLSTGPEVQLRNEAEGYQLKLTAISPSIRSLRVQAQRNGGSVLLAFSTSTGGSGEGSKTILAPGESVEWRIRVESSSISKRIEQPK